MQGHGLPLWKQIAANAPWDLKSGLEALQAEMNVLREVLSLFRAYTIKRRKIKLMLKRKAQLHFKLLFERDAGSPVHWHSWNTTE